MPAWTTGSTFIHASGRASRPFEPQLTDLGEPFFFCAREGPLLSDVRLPRRVVLVFGRERVALAAGIRSRYRDCLVQIPILDERVRSLNLSTSVALAVYVIILRMAMTSGREN